MLTLCGFASSNYHNKVKLALLEKGLPFEERLVWVGQADAAASPLGKLPYLLTDDGALCESAVIAEYLEDRHPQPALLPADAMARARVRELGTLIELHIELEARRLYPQAFFGGQVDAAVQEEVARRLERGVAALAARARFGPFIAGDAFTLADCAAIAHLPVVSMATRAVLGRDVLEGLPVRDYLKRMGERPTVQRVQAERKANAAQLAERLAARRPASPDKNAGR